MEFIREYISTLAKLQTLMSYTRRHLL